MVPRLRIKTARPGRSEQLRLGQSRAEQSSLRLHLLSSPLLLPSLLFSSLHLPSSRPIEIRSDRASSSPICFRTHWLHCLRVRCEYPLPRSSKLELERTRTRTDSFSHLAASHCFDSIHPASRLSSLSSYIPSGTHQLHSRPSILKRAVHGLVSAFPPPSSSSVSIRLVLSVAMAMALA